MTDLRVGVVGAGFIAAAHVNAYGATPGVRLVAVADPVADKAMKLAARADARAVSDLEQVLATGVDVVSVCTPSPTHADLVVQALEAGLHVLCEKPIARTLQDAQRVEQASRRASGLLMIGHVSRFEPDHRRAKDLVEAGHLGEVRMLSHSTTSSMPGWSEGDWLSDQEESGGPLVDLAVHSFDFAAWLTDSEPIRVHAVGADTAAGPCTYALATVRYANGAIALVETSWGHPVSYGFKLSSEVVGTDGRLSWDYDHLAGGTLHVADREVTRWEPLGDRGFRAEVRAFVDAIRASAPSPVPASAGVTALRTSLAARESVRNGTMVDLTTWGRA